MSEDEIDQDFKDGFAARVREVLQVKETPGDGVNLFDMGLDSAAFIQLMMDLEDDFGGFWQLEQLTCVADFSTVGVLRAAAWSALRDRDS